jgi:type II secretory pathway component PulF
LSLEQGISGGAHLSDVLRNHESVFGEFYINIIKSGELSGELENAVTRIREYLEKKMELRRNLINNLTYPAIMVCIGVFVVIFLFLKVLPAIVGMFQQMRITLPLPTRILISTVELMKDYGVFMLIIAIVLLLCVRFLMRYPRIKQRIHKLMLTLPVVGKMVMMTEMERFSHVLSTMLKSGIPLPAALESTSDVARNVVIRENIDNARVAIIEGSELAKVLRQQDVFPKHMIQLAHAGEKTGTLDNMFAKSALFFRKELELYTRNLSSLIEPAIILTLGILVGFIAISILLPIFEMNTMIGK